MPHPLNYRGTELERFAANCVRDPSGCVLWTASTTGGGYGKFGSSKDAHVWSYEHFIGPIPKGLEVHHHCRVRLCVNPEHLEAISHRENVLLGVSPAARQAKQTHCKRGHPLSGENLYYQARVNKRRCQTCWRVSNAEYLARKKERSEQSS